MDSYRPGEGPALFVANGTVRSRTPAAPYRGPRAVQYIPGVARTTKKRRRKHRGTQGGSIDRRGRARPRTREEARARARSGRKQTGKRGETPPTWASAIGRAAFGAAIFFVLLILLFKFPVGRSALLSFLMLLLYIPLGHAIDGFIYRRKLRATQREHEQRKAGQ